MASPIMVVNPNQEEILNGFNSLRNEQRSYASKVSELKADLSEHKLVLETLNGMEKERRCFRMVGGVLVERNVGDVVPALTGNSEKMEKVIETMQKLLAVKGEEIQDYMAKHNIRVQGNNNVSDEKKSEKTGDGPKASGVLVESNEK